jgi:hypothetical protein
MAWKFLKPRRWRKTGTEGFFSLADCTSDAASSNGTVIARNPIYQVFLRPSSTPCITSHRFSLCHFYSTEEDRATEILATSSSCLGLLQCRVVYVLPSVPKCAPDPRRRHYVFSSSGTTVIIIPSHFFRYSVFFLRYRACRSGNSCFAMRAELLWSAITVSTNNISGRDLNPWSLAFPRGRKHAREMR